MEKFDLCVIGAGPSGYAAAVRGLDFGKKVLLIEKNKVGGAGIWDGALSSKTLWELAKDISHLRVNDRGYTVHGYSVDYRAIYKTMEEAVQERYSQLIYQLHCFERELYPGRFRFERGVASFVSPNEVKITFQDGGEEIIFAHNIIIATGSRPRKLPTIPIDEETIVTSDGLGSFNDFPESLVILGAGVIGCEFASIFANFGQTKVYLIDKSSKILTFEDEDLTDIVEQSLEKKGVVIHHNAQLECMSIENGRVRYEINLPNGGHQIHYAEKALISIGRVNNYEELNLEAAGLIADKRGCIDTNDSRTCQPHIFVVGDMSADICLVNVGELEGRHAVELIFNKDNVPHITYDNVSTIMFLTPEVAGVGINEKDAIKKGLNYRVATYSYEYIGRAICQRNLAGFFKILVTDDNEMSILGMRAIGSHASSVIQAVALLILMNKGIHELAELIHPHPSITEGIQECVRMLLNKSILKPEVFKDKLLCYRVVNGIKYPLYTKEEALV